MSHKVDMEGNEVAYVQFEFMQMYSIWGPEIDRGFESGICFEETFTDTFGVRAAQLFARSDFYTTRFDKYWRE